MLLTGLTRGKLGDFPSLIIENRGVDKNPYIDLS